MVTTRPPKTIVKPTALGPVANTDTKLLIYGLFQKGRVLAQDGVLRRAPISAREVPHRIEVPWSEHAIEVPKIVCCEAAFETKQLVHTLNPRRALDQFLHFTKRTIGDGSVTSQHRALIRPFRGNDRFGEA